MTPRGEEYLDKLLIINVKDNHKIDVVREVSTKEIFLAKQQETSLFQKLCDYKKQYLCSFNFAINSKGHIAVACVLKNYIFKIFIYLSLVQ